MKTFEEALIAVNTLEGRGTHTRTHEEWESTEGANTQAIAGEVIVSPVYARFCHNALRRICAEEFDGGSELLSSAFTTAFVAGMRVGIEMEKQ